MASGLSHIVFNDEFTIDDIDKEGRKFDRGETTSPDVLRDRQHMLTQKSSHLPSTIPSLAIRNS
jgi:hypothetical protein